MYLHLAFYCDDVYGPLICLLMCLLYVHFGAYLCICVVLEDETGRVPLAASSALLPVKALSTGLVVAVAGVVDATGHLQVEKWCAPGPAPYNSLALTPDNAGNKGNVTDDDDVYVLLVSGLEVGGAHDAIGTSLLVDYVTGHLGSEEDIKVCMHVYVEQR
jgi:hypothetical protein